MCINNSILILCHDYLSLYFVKIYLLCITKITYFFVFIIIMCACSKAIYVDQIIINELYY